MSHFENTEEKRGKHGFYFLMKYDFIFLDNDCSNRE